MCVCFLGGSDAKESACNVGYLGLIPGLEIYISEQKLHIMEPLEK